MIMHSENQTTVEGENDINCNAFMFLYVVKKQIVLIKLLKIMWSVYTRQCTIASNVHMHWSI